MNHPNPKHHVMSFRFSGMKSAYTFERVLRELGLKASAVYSAGSWVVQTDTRCLAHAEKLTGLIGGAQ